MMVTSIVAYRASYEGYNLFAVTPTTKLHLDLLEEMEKYNTGFTFWKSPSRVNRVVDIMVAPHKMPEFLKLMDTSNMLCMLRLYNLEWVIEEFRNDTEHATTFDFDNYHTLERIYGYLDTLALTYPDRVEVIVAGTSFQGRQIKGVKVTSPDSEFAPGIFIEGGMNGREWISPATVMYILDSLLNRPNENHLPEIFTKHTWYIFPVLNPDGYVYTHTTDRLWNKNLKPSSPSCIGTNLNRNWQYEWNTINGNDDPCSDNYPGRAPFSEDETRTVSDYIRTISDKFYAYISFHSYSQHLMYPFGYTRDRVSERVQIMGSFAVYGLDAMREESENEEIRIKYKMGHVSHIYRPFSGSSTDYIAGHYNTSLVYIYDLRDDGDYGFLLTPDRIIPTGQEVLKSLSAILKEYSLYKFDDFRPENVS